MRRRYSCGEHDAKSASESFTAAAGGGGGRGGALVPDVLRDRHEGRGQQRKACQQRKTGARAERHASVSVWVLAELRDGLRRYFRSRNEDSIDIA